MSDSNYYLKKGDKAIGPLTFDRLTALQEQGKIQTNALVSESVKGPWITMSELEASFAPIDVVEAQTSGVFDLGGLLPLASPQTYSNWNPPIRESAPSVSAPVANVEKSKSTLRMMSIVPKILGAGIIAIGILSSLLFFSGSFQMQRASAKMSEIRSRGGKRLMKLIFNKSVPREVQRRLR